MTMPLLLSPDPKQEERQRIFDQKVALVLNSLIRGGYIVQGPTVNGQPTYIISTIPDVPVMRAIQSLRVF